MKYAIRVSKPLPILLLIIVISFSAFHNHAFGQTNNDSLSIRSAALHYIEGLYTHDHKRMEKAIHPELAKRVIEKDISGNYSLGNMGSSELIAVTKTWKMKDATPGEPFKAEITIFDIYNNIATIKVTQNKFKFIDYIHLGKIDNEWKIINVLWARTK